MTSSLQANTLQQLLRLGMKISLFCTFMMRRHPFVLRASLLLRFQLQLSSFIGSYSCLHLSRLLYDGTSLWDCPCFRGCRGEPPIDSCNSRTCLLSFWCYSFNCPTKNWRSKRSTFYSRHTRFFAQHVRLPRCNRSSASRLHLEQGYYIAVANCVAMLGFVSKHYVYRPLTLAEDHFLKRSPVPFTRREMSERPIPED